jgi:hypothetical protein
VALRRPKLRLPRRLPNLHLRRAQLLRLPSRQLRRPSPLLRLRNLPPQSPRRLQPNPRLRNDEFVISKIMKKPGSARLFC